MVLKLFCPCISFVCSSSNKQLPIQTADRSYDIIRPLSSADLRWDSSDCRLWISACKSKATNLKSSRTFSSHMKLLTGYVFGPQSPDSNCLDVCIYCVHSTKTVCIGFLWHEATPCTRSFSSLHHAATLPPFSSPSKALHLSWCCTYKDGAKASIKSYKAFLGLTSGHVSQLVEGRTYQHSRVVILYKYDITI